MSDNKPTTHDDEGDTRGPELSAKHQAEDMKSFYQVDRDNGELLPSQKNN